MTNSEPPSHDVMREQRLQRNLKIIVGALGLLILAGLGAAAVRVVGLATGPSGGVQSAQPAVSGQDPAAVSFEIPKGARIVSVSLSGNRLAVQHDGPGGPGITVLDAQTGKRVLEMKPVEAVPRN